jgi:hypothetical protein
LIGLSIEQKKMATKKQVADIFEKFCNFVGFQATIARKTKEELFLLSSLSKNWEKAYGSFYQERIPSRYVNLINSFVSKEKSTDLIKGVYAIIDNNFPNDSEGVKCDHSNMYKNEHTKQVFLAAFGNSAKARTFLKLAVACHKSENFEENVYNSGLPMHHSLKMALKRMESAKSFIDLDTQQLHTLLNVLNRV